MALTKVAELVIYEQDDRLKVSSVLVKNGYLVGQNKRKKTPTGKTLEYFLEVYEDSSKNTGE